MLSTRTISSTISTINWKNVAFVTFFHLLAIPVLFTFSLPNVAALLIGNWVVGSLGVGLGWHRLLTHRSFKAPKWLEYLLTILGTMSMQDSPDKWVATHRIHHKYTETESDPHSTRPGFWWAQIGWVVWGTAQDHDQETLRQICSRPVKRPCAASHLEVLLRSDHAFCGSAFRYRRLDDGRLGRCGTGRVWLAHNVVR